MVAGIISTTLLFIVIGIALIIGLIVALVKRMAGPRRGTRY